MSLGPGMAGVASAPRWGTRDRRGTSSWTMSRLAAMTRRFATFAGPPPEPSLHRAHRSAHASGRPSEPLGLPVRPNEPQPNLDRRNVPGHGRLGSDTRGRRGWPAPRAVGRRGTAGKAGRDRSTQNQEPGSWITGQTKLLTTPISVAAPASNAAATSSSLSKSPLSLVSNAATAPA